jgi:type II secretory pathway pseudopilin PulG
MMIAAAMIGILAAIAAPSFLGFRERQRVENARNVVYQAMRATQMDAMQSSSQIG